MMRAVLGWRLCGPGVGCEPRLPRGGARGSIGFVAYAAAGVIVALGGGVTVSGEPLPATAARARRAAGLLRRGQARRVIMSGGYGMYDPPPERAEATAMARIAVAAGVPAGVITEETRSRDTIGNIWFTKPLLRELRARRVIVVTSGWHAPRVRYLAEAIWGPGYDVAIEAVTGEAGTRSAEEIAVWETGLLTVSRRWLAGIRPGDDTAIPPSWPASTPSTPAIPGSPWRAWRT